MRRQRRRRDRGSASPRSTISRRVYLQGSPRGGVNHQDQDAPQGASFEHRQVRSPVSRRARELRSPGAGAEEIQKIWFFSYRLVPGALSGMPRSVGRQKTGTVMPSGIFMLPIIYIVALNIKCSKIYNTRHGISTWRAVARPAGAPARATDRPWPPHRAPGVHRRRLPNCPAGGGAAVIDNEEMYSIQERRDPPRHRP